jgi:zinc transport system permease protein
VSCSILGVFLVLRRLSLIGDGLAHVTFGSVAVALLLRASPLAISLPLVMVSSLGILKLTERARIHGDTAIGIFSSVGIALGIIIASVSGGFNIDLFSYLFGNILSIGREEVLMAVLLSGAVIATVSLFYHELLSITFDEELSRLSGLGTGTIGRLLVLLTAVTVVLAMKVVGIMLISAFLVLPASTALQIAKSFRATIFLSAAAALFSLVSGLAVSFFLDLPTGATIVLTNFALFCLAFGWRRLKR